MEGYRIAKQDNRIYSMGLTGVDGGIHVCVAAQGEVCDLLLYRSGDETEYARLHFPQEGKRGDVWNMTVLGDFSGLEYCFELDGKLLADPYGKQFTGREVWGDLSAAERPMRSPVVAEDFDWEGDKPLKIPYEEMILYRAHVRGFTKNPVSRVKDKGTFRGLIEKIPYLKELGVTSLELLPVNEFLELMMPEHVDGNPYAVDKPTGKLNYWGYTTGYYFAPKASYCSGKEKHPVTEFKNLVKTFHKEGLELIIELYFTGKENPAFVLDAVRYWTEEFHVDGVHLVGFTPNDLIGRDPYLSGTKLFATSWLGVPGGHEKHLAEYNDGFLVDMRRALKGDEDEMNHLIFRSRRNPAEFGVVNYMANTNGFTMMDMVSYDTKHNEANGEGNQDGNPYNYSWNCGVEGHTRRKKIVELRKKQIRNALLMLFLSQGTPLLLAGDEFGNSKDGNNNSYCQDNEVSWLNWNLLKTNRDIYEFTKAVIAFRKSHPVFHMATEPKVMDYLSCGRPDVSYHGVKAWRPEFENFRRQIGIMYCGEYGKRPDGTADDSFFVAYNMHWEPHAFDLPNLPKKQKWHIVFNTDEKDSNGMYSEGSVSADGGELDGGMPVMETRQFEVPPRTIVVFVGR